MRVRSVLTSLLLSTLGVMPAIAGCAESEANPSAPKATTAHLLALSTYSASLGTPIDAFLENAPTATAQKVELVFDGTFVRAGGGEERVALSQPADRIDGGTVRWTTFGPFGNPFTPSNPDIGTFRGKVGVKVTLADGTVTNDENPLPVEFEVKPSIILTELQPTTATCDKPALRLIGRMTYKMKAMALGFKPTRIEYAFKTPGITLDTEGQPALELDSSGAPQYRTTTVTHEVSAPVDTVDGTEALALPPVPPDRKKYGVVFSLSARDEAGRTVRSVFGMTAHNPLEVYDDDRFTLAQVYPAEPVSSCIPGGQQGRHVGYSESKSQTRQRSSTLSLARSWLKSDQNSWSTSDGRTISTSQSTSDSFARTHGTSNTFSFDKFSSTTTGVSLHWEDTTTIGASASAKGDVTIPIIPGLLSIGGGVSPEVHGQYGRTKGAGYEKSSTSGWRQGESKSEFESTTTAHSTATTDSVSVEKTDTEGGSTSESEGADIREDEGWTVTSSDTIERGFNASVIANTYGVFYRQLARYTRRAFVFEYTKCGESEAVGDIILQDYVWAADLALGNECTPTPASNFPKPQCYMAPCEEQ